MQSVLPLELQIGLSMVLSYIDAIVYHKVLERSKSVGTLISPVNFCIYYVKYRNITTLSKFDSIYTNSPVKSTFQLALTVPIPYDTL